MKIASNLNPVQRSIQEHLVRWKWEHIGHACGTYRDTPYDSILAAHDSDTLAHIYPPIRELVMAHQKQFKFKFHKHFNHMASSQAANMNLFLPILQSPFSADIFRAVKPDFNRIATEFLHNGWQIEYCDGFGKEGVLGDKNAKAGTDADIAIAYYNHDDELCLWLVEHKLTEAEFTTCGGAKSNGRTAIHDCANSFAEIMGNKDKCYYHSGARYNYWKITENNHGLFSGHTLFPNCPFKHGMNQLWRNMLLAVGVEQDDSQPYTYASFSVVHHPENYFLDRSMNDFRKLTNDSDRFNSFTSNLLVDAALKTEDRDLATWATWYRNLYKI